MMEGWGWVGELCWAFLSSDEKTSHGHLVTSAWAGTD